MKQRKEHGRPRGIQRRDFLQGVLIGAASSLTGALLAQPRALAALDPQALAPQDRAGYYPPILTGLRGSHPGSFENAHALRDGQRMPPTTPTGESYDLVVVGAGISGLSAAHFFRSRAEASRRVLVLDNHDDFGGHAKRNEFRLGKHVEIINGGTVAIDSPRPYSGAAAALLRELGVDAAALSKECEDQGFYRSLGLGNASFFDRETFGADKLVVGAGRLTPAEFYASAPLSEQVRADLVRVEAETTDYLPGLTPAEKKDRLSRMSYRDYLLDVVKVDPMVAQYYWARSHGEWGVGIDAVAALDLWAFGFPGFQGLALPKGSIARMGYTPAGYADTGGSARFHFPDGNASIARLLVRALIPEAVPGNTARDVVTAHADYAALDRPRSPVRLRLSSTVVNVRHVGDPTSASEVEVTYVREGRVSSVRARACVLACWNMMIPYLCPDLPERQKQALRDLVKTPLVYTTVAMSNWSAFKTLGISRVYAPGCYHTGFGLNAKVDIAGYRSPSSPEVPILVRMLRTPCQPGLPEREQHKIGRAELLGTPFATFEERIRDQLDRILGAGGFLAARDIRAITVNRWPHGYAPEYNPLYDPDLPEAERANVIGRARYGRIAIANSDAGAAAYTDSAINQADRAVSELLAL
jgi:spermidine dehydrogenase